MSQSRDRSLKTRTNNIHLYHHRRQFDNIYIAPFSSLVFLEEKCEGKQRAPCMMNWVATATFCVEGSGGSWQPFEGILFVRPSSRKQLAAATHSALLCLSSKVTAATLIARGKTRATNWKSLRNWWTTSELQAQGKLKRTSKGENYCYILTTDRHLQIK